MCARLWLELPCSGLSNPDWPTDSKQTSCKHVKSVPQTVQAYRQLSDNETKLLSDNILRVITRTVTYCRKQWNPVKKASHIWKSWNTWKILRCVMVKAPLRHRPFDFWGGGMGDLVWVRIFSPKPLVIEFFSWHTTVQDLFFQLCTPWRIFFFTRYFLPWKSVCRIFFFWNHPYPLKSQMVSP